MIKKLFTSFKEIGFLTIALTLALCANFAFGAWSNPPANPPSNNTAAPINVSSALQVKQGALDVGGLSVNGDQLIDDTSPSIKFNDTDARDFWLHANSNQLYLLGDRNNSGTWDSAYPARFYLGDSAASDYVKFSNRVLATAYCDENGNNCTDASAGPSAEVDPQVGTINAGEWCVGNSSGGAVTCTRSAPVLTEVDPQVGTIQVGKMCVGNSIGSAVTCSQNVPEPSLGSGQHWYDVTGSRSSGTTYTNNTGQSISVNLSGDGEWLNGNFQVRRPGGSWVTIVTLISNDGNWRNTTGLIIPDGYSYRMNGGYDVKIWAELR